MSDYRAVGSAVYSALGSAAGTVPVFYAMAPQGSAPPYVVFNRQGAVQDYTFNSTTIAALYNVQVITDRRYPETAAQVYDSVHNGLQGRVLTIDGYAALRLLRESTFEYAEPSGFWHVGGLYRIEFHKTGV